MKAIIIGGNAAGMSAASKLRRLDDQAKIVVFERGSEVSYGSCGLPYFIGEQSNDSDILRIRKPDVFIDKQNIDLRMGEEVVDIDVKSQTVTVKGNDGLVYEETYDKLAITSGSSPVVPPFPGRELKNIFTTKTIEDGENIKNAVHFKDVNDITIVGSGSIGMEVTESLLKLGKKIRIIEMQPHIMGTYDSEITEVLKQSLLDNGVDLHLEESVESFAGQEKVESIKTDKGSYPTDMVILSIGVKPNTQFIKDNQYFSFLRNGAIIVNERMETGIPGVYAGGDCATVKNKITEQDSYIALGTNANKQGKIIGENMADRKTEMSGRLGTSALRFMNLEIAQTGIRLDDAQKAGFNAESSTVNTKLLPRYYEDTKKITIKLVFDKHTRRILGASMVGSEGTALRIDIMATAISAGLTIEDVSDLDLVYSPPFAQAWDAVQVATNVVRKSL